MVKRRVVHEDIGYHLNLCAKFMSNPMSALTDSPNVLWKFPPGSCWFWQASTGFGTDQAGNGYGGEGDLTLDEAIDLAESELQGIVGLVNALYTDQVGPSSRTLIDLCLRTSFNRAVISRGRPIHPSANATPPSLRIFPR